ncbi:VHS/ENTH/ANTH domain-containing protein [Lysinibacillus xylanilyticus]|uniref:hypothetical protein n=1 Tax=Lysinibacillus xylanilyticus TaxID=582475 RepID=UPI0036DC6277
MSKSLINASAVTEALVNRQRIEGTTLLTSEELAGVEHSKVALLLYYLIANGSERSIEDFEIIGKHLYGIAYQVINKKG